MLVSRQAGGSAAVTGSANPTVDSDKGCIRNGCDGNLCTCNESMTALIPQMVKWWQELGNRQMRFMNRGWIFWSQKTPSQLMSSRLLV